MLYYHEVYADVYLAIRRERNIIKMHFYVHCVYSLFELHFLPCCPLFTHIDSHGYTMTHRSCRKVNNGKFLTSYDAIRLNWAQYKKIENNGRRCQLEVGNDW